MGKKSKESIPKKGSSVLFGIGIAAVAIAGIYLAMQQPGLSVGMSDTKTAKMTTTTTPKATKDDALANSASMPAKEKKDTVRSASDIPTYEEYIAKSVENKWAPVDPVEKLEATIAKYGQLYEVVDPKDEKMLGSFLKAMGQEVKHLMAVITQSSHHPSDLTRALHKSIDVVQEITYRTLKLALSSGSSRMVIRGSITNNFNHWMYAPLKELAKALAAKHAHLTIAVNAQTSAADASAVLEKVVKHRLYGLITVFLDLGADAASIKAALRMAAIQGDDVAISVLLGGLSRASAEARSAAWEFIPEVASLAERLGFTHVHARLQALLEQTSNSPSSVGYNDYVPFAWESHVPEEDSCISSLDDNTVDASGYASFKIAHTLSRSAGAAVDDSAPVASMGRPVCTVDRVPIGSITPEAFFTDYVLLNRPIVLLAATDNNSAQVEEGSSVWTLSSLLKQFGKTKDVSSAIPYATLFGHSEEIVTLEEFVNSPTTGMRAYTNKLSQFVRRSAVEGTPACATTAEQQHPEVALSGESLVAAVNELGLPRYIFSGVQQNMNKALRKHMLRAVTAFGAEPSPQPADTTESTAAKAPRTRGPLLDFLYRVSASNTSAATGLPRDFRSHWKTQFYLGPPLSGAPFHHHGPAFNLIMHGRKEWTLLPPGRDIYASAHPIEWLAAGATGAPHYPYKDTTSVAGAANQPCKLVQNENEVVFVPRHWTHQVLNLAESIGFAVEIDDYVV